MEPGIVLLETTDIVGFVLHTTSEDGRNIRDIRDFWASYNRGGLAGRLGALPGIVSRDEYGICIHPDMDSAEFDYVIGVAVSEPDAAPADLYRLDLAPCRYAVFESPSLDAIPGTWRFILHEWFPTSGYEFASGHPDFERYRILPGKDMPTCDIYVPVVADT